MYKTKVKASERPQIKSSQDCYNILKQAWDENKIDMLEEFKVLFLNRANRATDIYEVSAGGISSTIVDVRLVLAAAIKSLAVTIILSHNHHSGSLIPSAADEQLIYKIKEVEKFHDIKVTDHLIITSEGYYSFADERIL